MDYALWHGQHNWIVQLAAAGFPAAKAFVPEGVFLPASYPATVPKDKQFRTPTKLAVSQVRHRLLQPYSGHTFRNVLKPCDLHGVDHRTPVGATPLMMAARAGNVALIEELLARGADVDIVDEFGQTAWLHAASRAMDEPRFAADGLPAVCECLAPAFIDLQGGQLLRIERHEAEYWLLTLMLAGLKTQWSFCVTRSLAITDLEFGFKAVQLQQVLEKLPLRLWDGERRAPDFIEQVLERGRQHDDATPDEKPWTRTTAGFYMPNPNMRLLRGGEWRHIFDAIPIDWIEEGTGGRFSPGQEAVRGVSTFLIRSPAAPRSDASASS